MLSIESAGVGWDGCGGYSSCYQWEHFELNHPSDSGVPSTLGTCQFFLCSFVLIYLSAVIFTCITTVVFCSLSADTGFDWLTSRYLSVFLMAARSLTNSHLPSFHCSQSFAWNCLCCDDYGLDFISDFKRMSFLLLIFHCG